MKNLNPEIVEILDERRMIFKCKLCGRIWLGADEKGIISKKSWQCPQRCKPRGYERKIFLRNERI